jgi:hypothetical protein
MENGNAVSYRYGLRVEKRVYRSRVLECELFQAFTLLDTQGVATSHSFSEFASKLSGKADDNWLPE